jgi:O-methyltransferase
MKKITNKIKCLLISKYPRLKSVWFGIGMIFKKNNPNSFIGWGMVTGSDAPWVNSKNDISQEFQVSNKHIKQLVLDGKFILSQYKDECLSHIMDSLMWRHYVVYWSVFYAVNFSSRKSNVKNFVECGVCDGLTMSFVMKAALDANPKFSDIESEFYLYDSWDAMKSEYLLTSEKDAVGEYEYLQLETTKYNLELFSGKKHYNKGYIPESFNDADNPDSLIWMHIDLNSSKPSVDSLEFFFDKLESKGVILFDDYGWGAYSETKLAIDNWFKDKPGVLLPMPTGQCLFFKD